MGKALGIIEIRGLAAAVNVADAMVKAANVELKGVERAKGMGYMTVKVVGDVGAISAAIETGKAIGIACGKYVTSSVIANPAPGMAEVFVEQFKKNGQEDIKEEKKAEIAQPIAKAVKK